MKKPQTICFIFAAIMTAVTALLLTSCSGSPMRGVSERRSGYYSGGDDKYVVTAVSGVRETPYVADGAVGEMKSYTLVTVSPKSEADFDMDELPTYSAKTADRTFSGGLTVHPFASSYSAEFECETAGELTVTVNIGGEERVYEMQSLVTAEMFDYTRAIDAACRAVERPENCETRVRLIENPLDDSGLCWHVAFITADRTSGVLLDPTTAKTLAIKTD